MIIRRGGNVGPEEEAIRSQQGQWPHPQVIITIINKTITEMINLTLITNSEFPLCGARHNPWHVQVGPT